MIEFTLFSVAASVLTILIIFSLFGYVFGSKARARLSAKLDGRDWIVRSDTAFPPRSNCSVNLFHDTAVQADLPIVDEAGNRVEYVPGELWETIYGAISQAERFIYITGWSVDTTKTLLRTSRVPGSSDDETIGELLKRKASEGCRVLIHVWNEKMSVSVGDKVRSEGLMGVHDEDTLVYFKKSPVQVVLSYRNGDSSNDSFIFTHHQKSVIVDAPLIANNFDTYKEEFKQKVYSKLGKKEKKEKEKEKKEKEKEKGKDKKKEKKEKKDKKHKKSESESESESGPSESESGSEDDNRQLKGKEVKAVGDLVGKELSESTIAAFEEKVQSKRGIGMRRIIAFVGGLDLTDGRWDNAHHSLFRTLKHEHAHDFHNPWKVSQDCGPREPWHDIHAMVEGPVARDVLENFIQRWKRQASEDLHSHLFNFTEEEGFISIEKEQGNVARSEDSWNVQLFRSIDHYSATIKGIDLSIQECYINSIRNADRFLYIENQYFLGSSQNWLHDRDVGCENLIPFEIANKICSKIRDRAQFNVYIVIPMYPEGYPEDGPVQEVLFWQHRTQEFMFKMVHDTIEKVYGSSPNKPLVSDYLNFYCLGQRETEPGSEAIVRDPSQLAAPTRDDLILHNTRRFAIYVHSKLMIADDVFVILGSANINERSMSGYRDSEIAIGAYQPYYTFTRFGAGGRGEVHKFRMNLWTEHIGFSHHLLVNPNSVECAKFINEIADKNWTDFMGDEVVELKGHLMRYPIRADPATGKIVNTCELIPDTKAKFTGTKSFLLADKLTI